MLVSGKAGAPAKKLENTYYMAMQRPSAKDCGKQQNNPAGGVHTAQPENKLQVFSRIEQKHGTFHV